MVVAGGARTVTGDAYVTRPRSRTIKLPRIALRSAQVRIRADRPDDPAWVGLVLEVEGVAWQAVGHVREVVLLQDDELIGRIGLLESTRVARGERLVMISGRGRIRSAHLLPMAGSDFTLQAWVCPVTPHRAPGRGIALGTRPVPGELLIDGK